ncbi:hypothetical protein M501DRAFT_1000946 [Patellaria atrata CBS 101060]|uniref:tRNA (adenine(58)-N(1))-methyltransferase non-catalytic subunit TRM6 n=1 Tax=Patellaria atrata CBS 101060 TaxID=1346257 RepID=A0A9P4SFE3_9PEZI|nr:hypothetical protein M501DRAFT_1000946 [Patellaria atrata CBS 101060]
MPSEWHSHVRPDTHVVLELSSGVLKIVEIILNTNISIAKFGTFPTDALVGRPFHLTYEITDRTDLDGRPLLRIVPIEELNSEQFGQEEPESSTRASRAESGADDGDAKIDFTGSNENSAMKDNRFTVDDSSRQTLSMSEIEELKKTDTGSGKYIVTKILASHKYLDEKSQFSLAKYALRKVKKYLKRFTVRPIDVTMLTQVIRERYSKKIMHLRPEHLGLLTSMVDVHFSEPTESTFDHSNHTTGPGRWLAVDETGGLLVAAMAEKMGILYPTEDDTYEGESDNTEEKESNDPALVEPCSNSINQPPAQDDATSMASKRKSRASLRRQIPAMSASTNTITLINPNIQSKLHLLKHFNFDQDDPDPLHPLYTHLKTLSWIQLLHTYADRPEATPEQLDAWTSTQRGSYYRKLRRWELVKSVVDDTRSGGFDGIILATPMEPQSILKHTLPLLRGGAQVVVYWPHVEPLSQLHDLFSRERKSAFADRYYQDPDSINEVDFPLNPLHVLNIRLQVLRARQWQVLEGRTHPMMTAKGGPEGCVFAGIRVIPSATKVEAKGRFPKKRKKEPSLEEIEQAEKRLKGAEISYQN